MPVAAKQRFATRASLVLGAVTLVIGIGGRMMDVSFPISSPDFFSGFGTVLFVFGLVSFRQERQQARQDGLR